MLFAVSGLLFMFFEETYIHMIVLFFHVITLKSVEHYKGLIIVFVAVKVFEPRNWKLPKTDDTYLCNCIFSAFSLKWYVLPHPKGFQSQ